MSEKCDIVIPVWNNLKLTSDCVESIKKHTHYPYRMVIIDNASDAPTREYLGFLERSAGREIVILRNRENMGFVKAVNRGMQFSDAAYVSVMNNDTIATDGWLSELIDILKNHDKIGIINPSSNSSCQFPGKLDIDTYAKTLKSFRGHYQELYTCRAFAMVAKSEVIKKIGYLDETYGMGYYDDSDYSKRAQKEGYKTVRAKASYVYHRESKSFDKIREKGEIFLKNENKFVSKWGRQIRVAYVLGALKTSSEEKRASSNINRIAKMGHQVWIFTTPGLKTRLELIDHECIRFFYYPAICFALIVFYKIWKRKKKKKLSAILCNNALIFKLFNFAGKILEAEILLDGDFPSMAEKVKAISYAG